MFSFVCLTKMVSLEHERVGVLFLQTGNFASFSIVSFEFPLEQRREVFLHSMKRNYLGSFYVSFIDMVVL